MVPIESAVPPDATVNQSMVSPAAALALIFTVPDPHRDPLTGEGVSGREFTVSCAEDEVRLDVHVPLITHL